MYKKLSVIMPTWNRANVITGSLESLALQKAGSIELCIVDDGSTDNTEEVVNNFSKKNSNFIDVKYLKTEHLGVSHARNAGLKLSTSDVIAYLDSDNRWNPNFSTIVLSFFEQNPDCMTAYGRLLLLDTESVPNSTLFYPYDRSALLYQNFIDMNVFVHRKQCVEDYGAFDTSLRQGVDWDLVIRYTKDKIPMQIKETLCYYYISGSPNRISNTENMKNTMRQIITKNFDEIEERGLIQQVFSGHPHRHASLVQPTWDQYYREILSDLIAT